MSRGREQRKTGEQVIKGKKRGGKGGREKRKRDGKAGREVESQRERDSVYIKTPFVRTRERNKH